MTKWLYHGYARLQFHNLKLKGFNCYYTQIGLIYRLVLDIQLIPCGLANRLNIACNGTLVFTDSIYILFGITSHSNDENWDLHITPSGKSYSSVKHFHFVDNPAARDAKIVITDKLKWLTYTQNKGLLIHCDNVYEDDDEDGHIIGYDCAYVTIVLMITKLMAIRWAKFIPMTMAIAMPVAILVYEVCNKCIFEWGHWTPYRNLYWYKFKVKKTGTFGENSNLVLNCFKRHKHYILAVTLRIMYR